MDRYNGKGFPQAAPWLTLSRYELRIHLVVAERQRSEGVKKFKFRSGIRCFC